MSRTFRSVAVHLSSAKIRWPRANRGLGKRSRHILVGAGKEPNWSELQKRISCPSNCAGRIRSFLPQVQTVIGPAGRNFQRRLITGKPEVMPTDLIRAITSGLPTNKELWIARPSVGETSYAD